MMKRILIVSFLFLMTAPAVYSQAAYPFWNDVQQFKKQDSISFPAANQILFIGSSSFTLWKDVHEYFPGYRILNRAFGGSTLNDVARYRYDVIYPYQPKQIVLYCGENDFASSDTVTVDMVVQRFKTLFDFIRAKYPAVPFAYVAMKPSPSRARLMQKYAEANQRIQQLLKKEKLCVFVDVYSKMLKPDGTPMDDIFLGDNLHMNAKGYAIWKKLLLPVLKK
ncbi:MAG: GDSL-type esterase/lipase family protein [Lacibacter sp.]